MKKQNSKNGFKALGAWLKERVRKALVAIKKNPQAVPLVSLCITFLHYSLNLSNISDTTARIQGENMGLAAFVAMLALLLSFVCMLGAFPKRQKPKIAMVIIMLVLYGATIFAEYHYLNKINEVLYREINPIPLTDFIAAARDTLSLNIIFVAATSVFVLLEPVIAKLLRKINTSIEIEEGQEIKEIDISAED